MLSVLHNVQYHSFFDRGFHVYSFSHANHHVKPLKILENKQFLNGDLIVLPPDCVDHLTTFNAKTPYQFKLTYKDKFLFCGVAEFTADDHLIYVPDWMMSYLDATEGDSVSIINVTLEKCNKITFQVTTEFMELYDPKTIVEYHLRFHSILSMGQLIRLTYGGDDYTLIVIQLEPADHVSIVDSDIEFSLLPLDE
jgi:ubiquitin fusion degradation protein 1